MSIARRIVLVTPRLEAFQWAYVHELLERVTKILEDVSEAVERLRRQDEASARANPEAAARAFEARYRTFVAEHDKLAQIELFGANLSQLSRRLALRKAFVYLNVASDVLALRPDDDRHLDALGGRRRLYRAGAGEGLALAACERNVAWAAHCVLVIRRGDGV